MKEKQQDEVLRAVEEGTDKLIQKNITDQKDSQEADVQKLMQKLDSKFEKDELIQVAENFLDQK